MLELYRAAREYVNANTAIVNAIKENMRHPSDNPDIKPGDYVLDEYGQYAYKVKRVNRRNGELVSVTVFPAFPTRELTDADKRILKVWEFRVIDQKIFAEIMSLKQRALSLKLQWEMLFKQAPIEYRGGTYRYNGFMSAVNAALVEDDIERYLEISNRWQLTPRGGKPIEIALEDGVWKINLKEYGRGQLEIEKSRLIRFIATGIGGGRSFYGLEVTE